MSKLYIVMVGLPARGKSTAALRLSEGLSSSGIKSKVFNNGNLRRELIGESSTASEFYAPDNLEGKRARQEIALKNIRAAREYLEKNGQTAIIDATNISRERRKLIESLLDNHPILYIECFNTDPRLIDAGISTKAKLPEFSHLSHDEAIDTFNKRIKHYQSILDELGPEKNYLRLDTLNNSIVEEKIENIPFYINIRDVLVSDCIRGLILARHGQTLYNIENRIGGDSSLTKKGKNQAEALAKALEHKEIPYIFTSSKKRSRETAQPFIKAHPNAHCIAIKELDEIDAGICESMSYSEIKELMPQEYAKRQKDKYKYVYPQGEGYISLLNRVELGLRKAFFLSGGKPNIVMIGHQAINRMILSLFLYRRTEDVPYIFIPQDQYFHIISTHQKKLFELVPFMDNIEHI